VNIVVEQTGDVPDALWDVGNVVFGLCELQRVGGDEAHIDILQTQDIDEILDRTLAKDWQHSELVGIVEHRGHVGAHDRHRAADWRRDHRDSTGIEKVALGEFVALSRGALLRTGGACKKSPQHANGNATDRAHENPPRQFLFSAIITKG
jgi:hypothetical protein